MFKRTALSMSAALLPAGQFASPTSWRIRRFNCCTMWGPAGDPYIRDVPGTGRIGTARKHRRALPTHSVS
jgi:hypothetical protein